MSGWIQCCDIFKDNLLIKEAQEKCIISIVFSAQGLYKEAMITLRQFFEHLLFGIMLSTSDYDYRLWKEGSLDMTWARIIDNEEGLFSKKFIRVYGKDINEERSIELNSIAKNIYRECSEFVHGNYCKLVSISSGFEYDKTQLNFYLDIFNSVKYCVSFALFIRFRELFDDKHILSRLESIVMDSLGTIPEIQYIYGKEE